MHHRRSGAFVRPDGTDVGLPSAFSELLHRDGDSCVNLLSGQTRRQSRVRIVHRLRSVPSSRIRVMSPPRSSCLSTPSATSLQRPRGHRPLSLATCRNGESTVRGWLRKGVATLHRSTGPTGLLPKNADAASDERACDSIGSKRLLVTLYAVRYHCFDAELADLEKMSRDGIVNLALVYLGIGKRVDALDNLERALAAIRRIHLDPPLRAALRGALAQDGR